MDRFTTSEQSDFAYFKEKSKAANTKKSTDNWVNVYESWAKGRGYDRKEIFEYTPEELDNILHKFYVEIRKKDGSEYEPNCLNVMHSALDRHLKNNGYKYSIVRDREFSGSKAVLEGVARTLREKGKGKRPNRTRSLTTEEEEILWTYGEFGCETPRALVQTMWWLISQHFGMRGREEHHGINIQDFIIETDEDGQEFVRFSEGMTKNHTGGLNHKERVIHPKMYSTGDDRCPVMLFKLIKSKRPIELRDIGRFYLAVIDKPKNDTMWYKKSPMGIHTIDCFMKNMVARTPLRDVKKKFGNQSARKTSVRKMKKSGFVNSQIKTVTGHSNEKSLESYDSGDEGEIRSLSSAISSKRQENQLILTPASSLSDKEKQSALKSKSLQRNFSFGLDENLRPLKSKNTYIFNNCSEMTFNMAELNKQPRKKRRVIFDDSSDEN